MIHKHSNSNVINMVNYLANSYGSRGSFYSFCRVTGANPFWAWIHDNEYYCAIFLTREPETTCVSDQEDQEKEQLGQGLVYAALLKGCDNCSYIKRFETRQQMEKWALELEQIDIDNDPTLLYYNS